VAAYDGEGLTSLCDEHGLLTARRALESGVTDRCLQRLTRGGLLVHLFRGVYLLGSRRVLTAEGFHAQLMRGARLLFADAVFTSSSAVVGHGVEVYGASLAQPIIRRPVDRGQGPRGMVVRRQASAWVDTAYGPCVPLATALVEVAINRGVQAGMVTAELALASGKVSRAEFGAAIEAVALWPHSSRAKAVGRLVRGQCESVAEARTLFLLLVNGVEVECQVEICDPDGRFVARVDFLVTGTNQPATTSSFRLAWTSGCRRTSAAWRADGLDRRRDLDLALVELRATGGLDGGGDVGGGDGAEEAPAPCRRAR
jgi:hypothetical protein